VPASGSTGIAGTSATIQRIRSPIGQNLLRDDAPYQAGARNAQGV
jgi:hypothetical protein